MRNFVMPAVLLYSLLQLISRSAGKHPSKTEELNSATISATSASRCRRNAMPEALTLGVGVAAEMAGVQDLVRGVIGVTNRASLPVALRKRCAACPPTRIMTCASLAY